MLAAQLACSQGGGPFNGATAGGLDALPDGGAGEHTARAFQLLRALHPAGPNAASQVRAGPCSCRVLACLTLLHCWLLSLIVSLNQDEDRVESRERGRAWKQEILYRN